jgi:uncharacterized membrane protein YczE
MGLGISLVVRSTLGTSPISSVPYVLSLAFPLTFGEFTFLITLIFFIAEIAIIGKDFPRPQYFQILIALLLGTFVDVGMFLSAGVQPGIYPEQIAIVFLGSAVLALGIFLQITANVILNPGEGLVRAIAEKTHKRFGIIKVMFDTSLVAGAAVISFAAFGTIEGLREGTVISSVLVGYIILGFALFYTRYDLGKYLQD